MMFCVLYFFLSEVLRYFLGRATNNVLRITPDGKIREVIDADGAGMGRRLKDPSGIATDAAGNQTARAVTITQ